MHITYNLRILRDADSALSTLVNHRDLLPCPTEKIQGANGTVYRPSPSLNGAIEAANDLQFRLGETVINCQTYALPPEEYAGLLLKSPGFRQHKLAHLLPPLTTQMDAAAREKWLNDLAERLQVPAQIDNEAHLLPTRPSHVATWLPGDTRLIKTATGWFLCLAFEVSPPPVRYHIKQAVVGIDIGLRTLAVAVHKESLQHHAAGIADLQVTQSDLKRYLPNRPDLWQGMQRTCVMLQHAAAREELARMLDLIVSGASLVGFEKLNFGGDMCPLFTRRARELGLRDFLKVWLPRRLQMHRIEYIEVPSDLTSRLCNVTGRLGQRSKTDVSVLTNGNGEVVAADANAAKNIGEIALVRSWQRRIEKGA
ncbi:transposase [Deinococcus cavernae]|uniref:Transposase n=1 Tax=Deinococcus cavernae TaxID=2320857 RepID=A0A418V9J4_9DEIO|nr:transposase [Deinococcus cavernae]RJF72739.1 transposase [Deinococcus cavernae]